MDPVEIARRAMGEAIGIFVAAVTFVATCAGILIAAPGYFERRLTKNPAYRRYKVVELRTPAFGRFYLRRLSAALTWLDEAMGPLGTVRGILTSFGFCLTLALIYTPLFLVFGWSFFGASSRIGTLDLMPGWHSTWRPLFVFVVVAYAIVMLFPLRRLAQRGALAFAAAFIMAVSLSVAIAVVGVGALAVAFAVALVGGAALAGAMARAMALAGALAAGAGAGGGSVAWLMGFGQADLLLLLFSTALPLVNAGPDLVSWWVSRWLGGDLVRSVARSASWSLNVAWALGHMVADLFAAVGFFLMLAFLMPQVVGLLNRLSAWTGSTAALPLWGMDGYLCQAARDPWGEGAWPMLMLLSTLVPTALHFLMVLWSLLVVAWLWCFRATGLADRLAAVPEGYIGEGTTPAISSAIDDAAWRLTWAWFAATVGGCALLAGGWVVFVEIDHAWLDVALGWLKWLMLWAAYGGDAAAVDACLA